MVGDSIAWGQGAGLAEERLAPRLVQGLADHGVPAVDRVFAVPGARSADLAAQVSAALVWAPDVTLVVIGANDLTHFVPSDEAAADLTSAVRRLRAAGGEVVVAPAPDLGMVERVPPSLRPLARTASEELRRLQTHGVLELGARVADGDAATSREFAADRRLFSADRFHPSSAGYAVIATALLPEVLAAARGA